MTAQRALMVVAVIAGLVAGVLYHASAQRVSVVVAASDLAPGRAITAVDVETRWLPPDALPTGTIAEPEGVIGRFARAPIWKGQLVLGAAISGAPGSIDTGVTLPTGHRAIAIPVSAAHAVGGAVIPGARVDVISVPIQGRAPAGRGTELIAQAALVVDVRGEQGGTFERQPSTRQSGATLRDRLGSVVVAVGPTAQMWIADRIASSTFVIALVHDRP